MYGNEFKTKGNKITPRIKLNHNMYLKTATRHKRQTTKIDE